MQSLESIYMGKLRAKDIQIESLQEEISDKEAIANDRIQKTRQ